MRKEIKLKGGAGSEKRKIWGQLRYSCIIETSKEKGHATVLQTGRENREVLGKTWRKERGEDDVTPVLRTGEPH